MQYIFILLILIGPGSPSHAQDVPIAVPAAASDTVPYQQQNAEQKSAILEQDIVNTRYSKLPSMTIWNPDWSAWQNIENLTAMMFSATQLNRAFDRGSDEIREGRKKVIHGWGSVGAIAFIPETGHPFTGLFRTGAIGLARFSLALPQNSVGKFVPGLALKFLVDGKQSRNVVVMERLEGQGNDHNYFAKTFTNRLPEPTEWKTKLGKKAFELYVKDAIHLNVDHVASIERDGHELTEGIVAPYQVFFVPDIATDSAAPDVRVELAKIPVGTTLYHVFGTVSAEDTTQIPIGTLRTTSEIIASDYGDCTLYFQHEGVELRWLFKHWPFTK